jgi:hypothetical protein
MKRRLVLAGLVFVGAAIAFTPAPPAWAKGATQAVITGPGISKPITLAPSSAGQSTYDPHLEKLAESSGFYLGVWGGRIKGPGRLLAHQPAGDLGPRYTITYTMLPVHGKIDDIAQYVYPFAEPRPITFMPSEQTYWGKNTTVGAWYAAHLDLKRMLVSLGLPATVPATAPVSVSGSSGSDPGGRGSAILALAVVAVLFASTAVFAWRRREHPSVAT